ncbi:MAG TPA: CsgG/HfaB family protein [Sedimentisphaerales bacterium]|nr:CsgG/HfaB family protein [Sedimentisphaerales bacterium]HRS10371.1 CsgG/HfaB family protein [Sedimentisphaerales bacterium]HRV47076.1 CsgG/HfaB family protein [Sedimentisphaerales bacterium]
MRTVCLFVVMGASLVAGCASSQGESYAMAGYDFAGLNKVAIVDVTGRVYGEVVKNQISDFFVMELMKRGYNVIERQSVQALLKEQEFQASDITSNEDAARAGRISNVPAVLVINIPKYKDKMEMTAKLLDVEDASILWIGSGSGSTGKGLATFVGAAAGAAAGAVLAGGDTSDRVIGGVAGGVVGGVAGNALSPDQEKQVKKVIAKVCETLPSRIPQPPKK